MDEKELRQDSKMLWQGKLGGDFVVGRWDESEATLSDSNASAGSALEKSPHEGFISSPNPGDEKVCK